MDKDRSSWNSTSSAPQTSPATAAYPEQAFIDAILSLSGHFLILGVPALVAALAFLYRIRWLRVHRRPHSYGRTFFIFWPTQLLIALAVLSLLGVVIPNLGADAPETHGLVSGASLMMLAWTIALRLNYDEHRHEIRSSNFLFVYYSITLLTSLLSLYILQAEPITPTIFGSFDHMSLFTVVIAVAFVIEAFPRTNTRVQITSREEGHLTAYDQANLFSRWTHHYLHGLVTLGSRRPLTADDIKDTEPAESKTRVNYEAVAASWDQEILRCKAANKTPSFMLAVIRAYRGEITLMMLVRLIGHGFSFVPPVLFSYLLRFFVDYHAATKEGREPPELQYGFLLAFAMFLSTITSTLLSAKALEKIILIGVRARAASVAMIYRKTLKLSPQARQTSTLGQITNHMAIDAQKWIIASNYMPLLITVPFELAIGIYLLYRILGWSLLAGLAVVGISMPIQGKLATFMTDFANAKLKRMDERLRLMTEILTNIKIVKLYGWEDAFREKIDAIRVQELHARRMLATITSILTILFSSVTLLMALPTFIAYAISGGKMTSEVIFVSIALFGTLNKALGMTTPMISQTIAVGVAMKRLQSFLLLEEIDHTIVQRYSRQVPPSPSSSSSSKKKDLKRAALAVDIEHGTFAWEQEADPIKVNMAGGKDSSKAGERQPLLSKSSTPSMVAAPAARAVLTDINLQILEGNLTAVVGRIGQGKSSLLSAIMGEMYKKQGTITVYGDIAYVPQQAWIINATLRDNILFGNAFDQALYDRIIYASGLRPDLEMLPAGDQTEIGEKGINLSGGQKQRVSLARAAYQDADVYLLDDPLSAVDAHVDRHLWQDLIGPDGLLKHKTRILVTHGIHHLEHVDQIVVLKEGVVSETGAYEQLMKARGAFYQLIKDYTVVKKKKKKSEREKKGETDDKNADADAEGDTEDGSERSTIVEDGSGDQKDDIAKGKKGGLIEDEKMEAGKIGWRVVNDYAKAVTYRYAILSIGLFALHQASHIGTNMWLRYWIQDTDGDQSGEGPHPTSYYLLGYGLLVCIYMVFDMAANYVSSKVVCGIQAARTLHDRLITHHGNRFSSDIEAIDSELPEHYNAFWAFTSVLLGTLFVIAYSTPAFLILVPPLTVTYYLIQDQFIRTSGSLNRLNATSRSPLLQQFSETVSGVSTVRVMKGLSDRFIRLNETLSDAMVNRINMYLLMNRWIQVRLEFLGAFTVFAAAVLAVWNADRLDPSLVGLALSYALNMVAYIYYLVRTVSE
ncbi:Multidrug resistance-associated protein 1, partial [Mortierella alpina]